MQFNALEDHRIAVIGQAGIDLPTDLAPLSTRLFPDGQHLLGPSAQDLAVDFPGELPGGGTTGRSIVSPVHPPGTITLKDLERQRRIGGATAKHSLQRTKGHIQQRCQKSRAVPPGLTLLSQPVCKDEGRRVPPDLRARVQSHEAAQRRRLVHL